MITGRAECRKLLSLKEQKICKQQKDNSAIASRHEWSKPIREKETGEENAKKECETFSVQLTTLMNSIMYIMVHSMTYCGPLLDQTKVCHIIYFQDIERT